VAGDEATIANLKWIHDQSLAVQTPLDLRIAAFYSVPLTLMAMVATLAGWAFWKLVRLLGIIRRKAKYRADELTAA